MVDQERLVVVPGEMQPWTDDSDRRPLTGGPAVRAWLADALPRSERALVAGPHSPEVIALVAERAAEVSVLLRSPSDASAMVELTPANVTVVSGSLDGFVSSAPESFDLVVALDGLDRLTSTDSPDTTWPDRLAMLCDLAGPQAHWVVRLDNELAARTLLDARVAKDRDGDEEWWPIHSDPTRPAGRELFAAACASAFGRGAEGTWCVAGDQPDQVVLASGVADGAAVDGPVHDAVRTATRAARTPLLAAPDETLAAAVRAGRLGDVLDAHVVASFGGEETTLLGSATGVLRLASDGTLSSTPAAPDTRLNAGEGPAEDTEPADPGATEIGAVASVSGTVPAGPSLTTVLNRAAEAEDVPTFRALAARVGELVLARDPSTEVVTFDDVRVVDGALEVAPTRHEWAAAVSATDALTIAWSLYQRQLLAEHRRHPWPPWLLGPKLTVLWLQMSGIPGDPEDPTTIAAVEAVAPRVDAVLAARPGLSLAVPDLRTRLADVDSLEQQLTEARGHIFGLERTIGFRDRQLRSRERIIHGLRGRVAKVDRLRATRAFKVAKKAQSIRSMPQQDRVKEAKKLVKKVLGRMTG